ncbi:hypothetical protein C4901_11625 [Acidiferrobacter sp. SPIII_3]|jgi:predicted RNase H-like nuclease (RuvC/YqgF family)|uniref:hypothetical protein n=1 Tax=Acidiferrobacter sp. SPIII_3 TaxID=1281578 RepID=UPI000D73F644|nr:hypothetical protein [Acidiferrobacter sp. SPIII_3]AWP23896.1 hypothetical protein C4901_11625 [Acidiferrobacter sp. SPIII_3]
MSSSRSQIAALSSGFGSVEIRDAPKASPVLTIGIDPGKRGALAAIDDTRRVLLVAKAPDSAAGMVRRIRVIETYAPTEGA